MNTIYMVHPNNHLTKLDKFTIPNLESYKRILESQINKLIAGDQKSTIKTDQSKLIEYKRVEKSYIVSYLNILKLLEGVDNCGVGAAYDYDKEDEILNSIEIEMIEFKKNELKLKQLRGDPAEDDQGQDDEPEEEQPQPEPVEVEPRRESIIKVEEDRVENIENVDLDNKAEGL